MRTMFNIAIKEGIVDSKHYLFAGDNIKIKIGSSMKIGLPKDEVTRIENLELKSILVVIFLNYDPCLYNPLV